ERLEIIKGPASSSWGSAMGGVINIITKEAWKKGHEGQMAGSYGTADSRELKVELSGRGEGGGYYLFAGNQHSDGLEEDRFFDNTQVYVKGNTTLKSGMKLMLSGGSFRPEWKNLNFLPADLMITTENRDGFFTSALDQSVGNLLSFHLSGGIIARNYTKEYNVLSGMIGSPGETLSKQYWREKSYNLNSRLVYNDDIQTFVLGAEYVYNRLESSVNSSAPAVAAWRVPPTGQLPPDTNRTVGVYINDTLSWDRFTLTPGIRYDYNSISDDFLSPSLGLVYRATENNRLRITAARGFSTPYFSLLRDISRNQPAGNPNLKPEKIWSIQAGLETRSIPFLLCKTTFFYHDIDDIWEFNPDTGHIENNDNTRRSGFEVEAESVPFHGLSVAGGFTYTVDDPDSGSSEDFYNTQIKVNYSNPELFSLQLFGTAIKWLEGTTFEEKEDFIWDLNINRHFSTVSFGSGFDLFLTVHNLFNGDQYWSSFYPNPERWIEAGVKFRF
ncbi:TonB-dependent receptor plug domain-containing protein, partial [Desulfomarina sp.]